MTPGGRPEPHCAETARRSYPGRSFRFGNGLGRPVDQLRLRTRAEPRHAEAERPDQGHEADRQGGGAGSAECSGREDRRRRAGRSGGRPAGIARRRSRPAGALGRRMHMRSGRYHAERGDIAGGEGEIGAGRKANRREHAAGAEVRECRRRRRTVRPRGRSRALRCRGRDGDGGGGSPRRGGSGRRGSAPRPPWPRRRSTNRSPRWRASRGDPAPGRTSRSSATPRHRP